MSRRARSAGGGSDGASVGAGLSVVRAAGAVPRMMGRLFGIVGWLITMLCAAGVLFLAVGAGYRLVRAEAEADVYRTQLGQMRAEYASLRDKFNEAVRRTTVTELVVEGGKLSARFRDASGVVREIPTTLDPSGEVYVDYVLLDGRLFIRRIFDQATPPARAVVLDDALAEVVFAGSAAEGAPATTDALRMVPEATYGKAVYRSLGEGVWTVTVSGSGALGLARVEASDLESLQGPAEIRDFEEVGREALERASAPPGFMDVLRRLVGMGGK